MKLQTCIPRSSRRGSGVTYLIRLNVGTRKRSVVSSTPRAALSPSEKPKPLTLSIRSCVGRRAGLGKEGKNILPLQQKEPRLLRRPTRDLLLKYSVMPDDGFLQRPKHVALYHSLVCYKYSCDWLPSCPLFRSIVTIPTEQSTLFPQTQTLLHFTSSQVRFDVQNHSPLRAWVMSRDITQCEYVLFTQRVPQVIKCSLTHSSNCTDI